MQPNNPGPMAPLPGGPMRPLGDNPYAALNQNTMPLPKASRHFPWLPVVLTITLVLLAGTIGGFVWAYMSREDYKKNSDQKVAAAVEVAKKDEGTVKDKEFAEKEKNPLKEYKTPAAYGSVSIMYPKTWSAYVAEASSNASLPVDAYFHPNIVPGFDSGTAYALRVQVTGEDYARELKHFDSLVKNGRVKTSAYQAPKMTSVTGTRVEGELVKGQKSIMVLLPLRDKTIKISTQSPQYAADFDNIVLANLVFVP
jgi:hypothetical protein